MADSLIIGVMPFGVATRDTLLGPLSFGLADLLSTDLARSRQITLVERARLGEVLREQSLTQSGAVDTASAPRVGRLLQAKRLIVGDLRFTPRREILFIARVTDVTTGKVDTALNASAPLNDVLAAEKAVAFRIFSHLRVNLTPQERALVEQVPTRNLAVLVAYGQGVQAEVNGQYAAARAAYQRAAQLDAAFTPARQRLGTLPPVATVSRNLPVVSPLTGAITSAIAGINRPLEGVVTAPVRGLVTDPAFPVAISTIIITITRP
jgi:TolB-like protein